MSENKKVFFIINKFSGTGYQPDVEGRIITECGRLGLECTIEFTQSRGHATALAKRAITEKFKTVFAAGGDGTVNEVAQGLLYTDARMGILPKGSGNGLARHLGIPMKFPEALQLLSSTRTIDMDTLLVNNKVSVNISGIGFDGHVAGLFGKDGKRGLVGYGKLVMKEFLRYKEFPVTIVIDGIKFERHAFIVALANSSQFGNNAQIAPHASVTDQLIEVCVIRKVPYLHAIGFAQKMFSGNIHNSAFVEIKKARKIIMDFAEPIAFHIDGEAMEPSRHFTIEVKPASLKMIIPEGVKKKV
jgi:diacylglycerol kinase (ATP)